MTMSENSHNLVKNITQSISQQKDATEQVLTAIRDISEGSLLLNNKVNENLDYVNAFSGLSNKLKALISQFKL